MVGVRKVDDSLADFFAAGPGLGSCWVSADPSVWGSIGTSSGTGCWERTTGSSSGTVDGPGTSSCQVAVYDAGAVESCGWTAEATFGGA